MCLRHIQTIGCLDLQTNTSYSKPKTVFIFAKELNPKEMVDKKDNSKLTWDICGFMLTSRTTFGWRKFASWQMTTPSRSDCAKSNKVTLGSVALWFGGKMPVLKSHLLAICHSSSWPEAHIPPRAAILVIGQHSASGKGIPSNNAPPNHPEA